MNDHFRAARALLVVRAARPLIVIALPSLLLGAGGGCIGVSAKSTGAAVPGAASGVQRCRALRSADDGGLDDLEDGNNQVTKTGGRDGYWWSAKDPKGSTLDMQVTEPGAPGSDLAMHISGTTVPGKPEDDSWGVLLGMNLVTQGLFYDASKYAGVAFKAKVGPGSSSAVRLKIADVNTHKDAGVCTACWNHFGKDLTIGTEWKEYRVTFSGAAQEPGWGAPRPAAVTPSKLVALNWGIGPGNSYDLWIDDVTFLECE
jgi:endoglucanase